MAIYYPQAAMVLRVRWEDFASKSKLLTDEYEIKVIPKKVRVFINSYREADKFSCELDFKSFPFDPRSIRALGVKIYMENMSEKLSQGVGFEALQIAPDDDKNLRFTGFADEETLVMNDTTQMVSFEGRDFTSLFIDRPYVDKNGQRPPIDLSQPIDVVFRKILAGLEEAKRMTVVNETGEKTLPTLSSIAPDFQDVLAGKKGTHKADKYWDVMQDIADRAGLIVYVYLDKLVISKPRVLYSGSKKKQFVYGLNLRSLEFKRKLGRMKGFNVEVRSMDFLNKSVGRVKVPEEASDAWIAKMGIPKAPVKIPRVNSTGVTEETAAPYYVFTIPDIDSSTEAGRKHMVSIAEGVYESVSRQEIEGELETRDMLISEDGKPFDVTKIKNGTPVEIYISKDDLHEVTNMSDQGKRAAYLKAHGYAPKVADALASTLGKFMNVFYTRAAELGIDEKGFTCKLQFINFLEAPRKK